MTDVGKEILQVRSGIFQLKILISHIESGAIVFGKLTEFAELETAHLGTMRDEFQRASTALLPAGTDRFGDIKRRVADWTGTAADNFDGFVGRLSDAIGKQSDFLMLVALGAETQRVTIEGCQYRALDIGYLTWAALGKGEQAKDKAHSKFWSSALKSVGSMIETVATRSSPAEKAIGLVTDILDVAGAEIEHAGSITSANHDQETTLIAAARALSELELQVRTVERLTIGLLAEIRARARGQGIVPPAPQIATDDSFDPRTFRLPAPELPDSKVGKVRKDDLIPDSDWAP